VSDDERNIVSHPCTYLRQPDAFPESRLPAGVRPLARPPALARAVELAFLRWERRDLKPTVDFWRDFGLHVVSESPEEAIARATNSAPCVALARRGRADRFIGPAFAMSDDTDLERLLHQLSGRRLSSGVIPGGGQGIEVADPAGRPVWLIKGQSRQAPLAVRAPLNELTNTAAHSARVNRLMRSPVEPASVTRLGHVVLQTVDFPAMAAWYLKVLGLIPSDVQYLADGSPNLAFCRLDLGDTPADHHTLVIVGGIEEKYEHSAYEVVDLDALGQGQQVLRAAGHRHMWGLGRHLIGSQLFDYWHDPAGFEFEHYTDGDLFTSDFETQYSPLEFGGIWAWGDDAPPSMKPRKDLRTLRQVWALLRSGKLSVDRLKLLGQALDRPARPWL
jgi:catechol 2,3-dioxygenase-like lactoylglutathione lyase family enzyme